VKKFIFLLLMFIMLFEAATMVNADSETEIKGACDILFDLGIIEGDENGNLGAEKILTRAEFSAVVTRIMDEDSETTASFSDMQSTHWAAPYVGIMAKKGIINGYPDGTFRPESSVTLAQAVKILLGVMKKADANLSYPDGYLLKAAREKITKGVTLSADEPLLRENAARLILNALYTPGENGEMLVEKLGVKTYFVSPDGSDENDGSYFHPFETINAAVDKAFGNAIVFLSEGRYEIKESIKLKSGEGVKKPLIIRAMLDAEVNVVLEENARITADEFVHIKGLYITKTKDGEQGIVLGAKSAVLENNIIFSTEVLVEGENCKILKNTFSGKKVPLTLSGTNAEIRLNIFEGQEETSLFVRGGSDNPKIYSNTFNISPSQFGSVVVIGEKDGAAVKNCIMQNNVIYDGEYNEEASGVTFTRTNGTVFYNNIIDGVKGAVTFLGENSKITLKNNIYLECGDNCYVMDKIPSYFVSDYNCFYETYPKIWKRTASLQTLML